MKTLRELSIPLRVRGWLPPQCLHVCNTWPPLWHSAHDPHSAPVTRTPVSHTPPCAVFFWGGRGLCFLCPQMSYKAITLLSFKSLLKCPFLNDIYLTTTFLTATFFPTSQHSISPFFLIELISFQKYYIIYFFVMFIISCLFHPLKCKLHKGTDVPPFCSHIYFFCAPNSAWHTQPEINKLRWTN